MTAQQDPAHPYPSNPIADAAWEIYETELRDKLESEHYGKLVFIDIKSHDYEIEDDHGGAWVHLTDRHPDAVCYAYRIGYPIWWTREVLPGDELLADAKANPLPKPSPEEEALRKQRAEQAQVMLVRRMIVGRVDRAYDAIIPVDFLERGSRLHRLEIPIDTGFEVHLMLPRHIVHQFGMVLERRVTMTLANEQDSVFERYLAEVLWFGRPMTVRVLALENQSLVGRYLLAGSHVEIDMIPGGAVTVSELPP